VLLNGANGRGYGMDSIPELLLVEHWRHFGNQLTLTILTV
jgi:aryl carrier-like protein